MTGEVGKQSACQTVTWFTVMRERDDMGLADFDTYEEAEQYIFHNLGCFYIRKNYGTETER